MTDTPLYDLRNVSKQFTKGPMNVTAVNGVSLTIGAG